MTLQHNFIAEFNIKSANQGSASASNSISTFPVDNMLNMMTPIYTDWNIRFNMMLISMVLQGHVLPQPNFNLYKKLKISYWSHRFPSPLVTLRPIAWEPEICLLETARTSELNQHAKLDWSLLEIEQANVLSAKHILRKIPTISWFHPDCRSS